MRVECMTCCKYEILPLAMHLFKPQLWTFWLALDCYHCQCLSYIHTLLILTTFLLNFAIVSDLMLRKLKLWFTMLNSLISISASLLFWHISRTALCLFQPASFSAGLLLLLHPLLKWLLHPHFVVLSNYQSSARLMHCAAVYAYLYGLAFICFWVTFISTTQFDLLSCQNPLLSLFVWSTAFCTLHQYSFCPALHLITCYFCIII